MIDIFENKNLQPFNTLAMQVSAEYFCEAHTVEDVQEAAEYARGHGLEITVLGGGSNVVFARDIKGLVMHIAIPGVVLQSEAGDNRVIDVGAGENWHQLVEYSLQQGWYGLENLALIPGLTGAAPIQNIGAYGVELKDVFGSLQAVDLSTGEVHTMSGRDCEFGYRDSIFKHQCREQFAITGLQLCLSSVADLKLDYPALWSAVQEVEGELTPGKVAEVVCQVRSSKLPNPEVLPNAGSFFKNPVVSAGKAAELHRQFPNIVGYTQADGSEKLAAGWLIDQCGWKGRRQGRVGVHDQQALVLVNYGGSGKELLALADSVASSVEQHFGVSLEIEPRVYK